MIIKNPTLDWVNGLREFLKTLIMINFFLGFFNLIPLHPLDGGKILARFLPYTWNRKLEENQVTLMYVLMIASMFGGLHFLAYPVTWLGYFLINGSELIVEHFLLG